MNARSVEEAEVAFSDVNAVDLLGPVTGKIEARPGWVVCSDNLKDIRLPLMGVKFGDIGEEVGEGRGARAKLYNTIGVGVVKRLE